MSGDRESVALLACGVSPYRLLRPIGALALITTAVGLMVAIPAVWLYNYFVNKIEYVGMEIQYAAKEFTDFMLKHEAHVQGQADPVVNRTPSIAWRRSSVEPCPNATTMWRPPARNSASMVCRIGV